ncbi:MAG: Holliday junction branch migration protein RuvA [Clostridiales bacterium]|nr:Holliday junction branch migration protein RuvA [Clostridiales bacterium]
MYAFISGTVEEIDLSGVVINNNGIGYYIQCPTTVLNSVSIGENAKIYTYQHVREDAIILYGFINKEDRTMFLRLISVSGIGPKIAIQVLSALSASELAIILVGGDASMLTKVPGIGKKTAQRLILELREKVDNDELVNTSVNKATTVNSTMISDAIYALNALGYTSQEAAKAVEMVASECKDTESIIKAVLKNLDRR